MIFLKSHYKIYTESSKITQKERLIYRGKIQWWKWESTENCRGYQRQRIRANDRSKIEAKSNTVQQADKVLNLGDDEHEYQV